MRSAAAETRILRPDKNLAADKRYRWAEHAFVLVFSGLVIAYLILAVFPNPDPKVLRHYHLTVDHYRWLIYPAVLLIVLSWIFALYGSLRVRRYAGTIFGTREGRAFSFVSAGLLLLTITQPLGSLLSAVFARIENHSPAAVKALTILNNYLNLIWMGGAMVLIAIGAAGLYKLAKAKDPLPQNIWAMVFIVISAIYSYFLVLQPLHTPIARRSYFLSDWLLILTIGVPYLLFWYVGLRAAYQLYIYQRYTQGKLYKTALRYLAGGVGIVVLSSVAIRIITTISTTINRLSLTPVLFIVYGIVILIVIGFILIAVGADRLKRIEEV